MKSILSLHSSFLHQDISYVFASSCNFPILSSSSFLPSSFPHLILPRLSSLFLILFPSFLHPSLHPLTLFYPIPCCTFSFLVVNELDTMNGLRQPSLIAFSSFFHPHPSLFFSSLFFIIPTTFCSYHNPNPIL